MKANYPSNLKSKDQLTIEIGKPADNAKRASKTPTDSARSINSES
jgi:hypothetical protein